MYSVVLMAALSAGTVTPTCWHWGGCGGGCYGSCYGCNGCYGGGYGCWGGHGLFHRHGCNGCYGGCYGCWGGCNGCYGGSYGTPAAPAPAPAPTMKKSDEAAPKKDSSGKTTSLKPAKVVVELPKDAKLFVDDQQMKTTAARRVFRTPELIEGQLYYYMLRAEVVRDGKPYSQTKQLIIRPGDEITATFT